MISKNKVKSSPARPFEAIFFDLFNTLVHFNYALLPEVEWNGERIPTTSVEVYRRLKEDYNVSFPFPEFFAEFRESRRRADVIKQQEHREVPSLSRFQMVRERLHLAEHGAAQFMVDVHMGEMFRIMYFPEEKRRVLQSLPRLPLVLVSNFDHAPTERRALEKFDMKDRFQAIFISEEVGWRKPSRHFFDFVLAETGLHPGRCLYVGDDPVADVVGAVQAGFQVAWLDELDRPEPALRPHWKLKHLSDLLPLFPVL